VAPDAPPPPPGEPLEDWIREPFDPADLDARVLTLLGRMRRMERRARRPSVDEDGFLRNGPHRVVLSPTHAALVRVLVQHLGEIVAADELRQAAVAAGASGTRSAIARALHRCRERLAPAELELHVIRGRGAMVCRAPEEDASLSG
jgi:DNA-binding response OmpR family regulator